MGSAAQFALPQVDSLTPAVTTAEKTEAALGSSHGRSPTWPRRHGLAYAERGNGSGRIPPGLPVLVQRKPTEQLRRAYGLLKIEPAKFLS